MGLQVKQRFKNYILLLHAFVLITCKMFFSKMVFKHLIVAVVFILCAVPRAQVACLMALSDVSVQCCFVVVSHLAEGALRMPLAVTAVTATFSRVSFVLAYSVYCLL